MDDPVPAIKQFGVSICIALVIAGVHVFLIFPAINSFPMLAMVLAPTMLTIGAMTLNPRLALPAFITLLTFCNYMAIEEHFHPDFARFINTNLSQFLGVFIAIYVTRSFRSISAEARARRLLKQTWKNLSRLARGQDKVAPEAFASRMIDRVALLAPQLTASTDEELTGRDALQELRVGMDLVALQDIRRQMPAETRAGLERLLHALGDHYAARSAGQPADDRGLLLAIDRILPILARSLPNTGTRGLVALVGLRRSLFPEIRFPAPNEAR